MATEREILRQLERKLNKEYKDTLSVVEGKIADFTKNFDKDNKLYLSKLKNGEIDEKTYRNWYKQQVTSSKWCNDMINELSKDMSEANKKASQIINGYTSEIYLKGCVEASGEFEDLLGFDLIDRRQVDRLLKRNKSMLPKSKVQIAKDQKWNQRRMRSAVLQSAIKGESIPKLAKRLQNIVGMNRNSSVRNARTLMTGSHNMGKLDMAYEAIDMGINVKKVWIATNDDRTRESHMEIDGVTIPVDEPFVLQNMDGTKSELMYPADPDGDPEQVYNCRCSMGYEIGKADETSELHGTSYEVLEHAKDAEKYVTDDLLEAVNVGSGELSGLDYRLKGKESLERKIVDKSVKKGLEREEYAKNITDALRYTNVSDSKTFTNDFYIVKNQLETKGYKMIEVSNSIADEFAEYRGINTLVKTPKGYTFELQFHTEESLKIKEINHKLYEEQRKSGKSEEEKMKLGMEMIRNAQSIHTPNGADKIKDIILKEEVVQW